MLKRNRGPMSATRVPTVLVVDDTEIVRKSAARCLRRRGYVVLEAPGVEEALALVMSNAGKIDLILTDLVLPTSSGIELTAQVQRSFPNIGIAYMTGHFGHSARCNKAPEIGARVLIKPFTPNRLEQEVREALESSGWNSSVDSALDRNGPNDTDGCGTH
jgi:two-component system cell cycle sensor histidine kinase/response regulator CckA